MKQYCFSVKYIYFRRIQISVANHEEDSAYPHRFIVGIGGSERPECQSSPEYHLVLGGWYGSNGYLFAFFWRIREVIWFAVRWTTGIGHRMWSVWLGRDYIETILQIIVYWSMSKRCSSVTVSLISLYQLIFNLSYLWYMPVFSITTVSQSYHWQLG